MQTLHFSPEAWAIAAGLPGGGLEQPASKVHAAESEKT